MCTVSADVRLVCVLPHMSKHGGGVPPCHAPLQWQVQSCRLSHSQLHVAGGRLPFFSLPRVSELRCKIQTPSLTMHAATACPCCWPGLEISRLDALPCPGRSAHTDADRVPCAEAYRCDMHRMSRHNPSNFSYAPFSSPRFPSASHARSLRILRTGLLGSLHVRRRRDVGTVFISWGPSNVPRVGSCLFSWARRDPSHDNVNGVHISRQASMECMMLADAGLSSAEQPERRIASGGSGVPSVRQRMHACSPCKARAG